MSRIRMCACFILSLVRFQYVAICAYVAAAGSVRATVAFLDEH